MNRKNTLVAAAACCLLSGLAAAQTISFADFTRNYKAKSIIKAEGAKATITTKYSLQQIIASNKATYVITFGDLSSEGVGQPFQIRGPIATLKTVIDTKSKATEAAEYDFSAMNRFNLSQDDRRAFEAQAITDFEKEAMKASTLSVFDPGIDYAVGDSIIAGNMKDTMRELQNMGKCGFGDSSEIGAGLPLKIDRLDAKKITARGVMNIKNELCELSINSLYEVSPVTGELIRNDLDMAIKQISTGAKISIAISISQD